MSIDGFEKATDAAEYVRRRIAGAEHPVAPKIAVVLGSGLGAFAERIENPVVISYAEIPNFPQSTVPGHSGKLVIGTIEGVPIAVMQGRVHGYEGYTQREVTFPVRVLGRLGISSLLVTNAAGGINMGYHQGQLVLLSDQINLTGTNPMIGPNDERFGPRFFDMTTAYSPRLRALAKAAAEREGFSLEEGVYLAVSGPSFETPAEIRAFRTMGADLVGMSTVPEVIAARHMNLEVMGVSCVTNMAAGVLPQPLDHEEVMETGRRVQEQMARLLTGVVRSIAQGVDGESEAAS